MGFSICVAVSTSEDEVGFDLIGVADNDEETMVDDTCLADVLHAEIDAANKVAALYRKNNLMIILFLFRNMNAPGIYINNRGKIIKPM